MKAIEPGAVTAKYIPTTTIMQQCIRSHVLMACHNHLWLTKGTCML